MIRWYFLSMEYHVYWLLKSSCFELSGDGKYSLFLRQKVDGKMMLTDYSNVLVLNHSVIGNTVFSGPKSWGKNDIYWLLKRHCFELFGNRKYGLFWAKKLMERWYLLVPFKPSTIFQGLGNMVFCAVFDYSNFSSNNYFLHGLLCSLTPWGGPMVDRKARTFKIFICRFLKFHGRFEEKLTRKIHTTLK